MNPSNVPINIIGVIVALPVDMGGVSGEVELQDGGSGQRLLAMTAHRDGSPLLIFECLTTYGHARHGMKKWSKLLAKITRENRGD